MTYDRLNGFLLVPRLSAPMHQLHNVEIVFLTYKFKYFLYPLNRFHIKTAQCMLGVKNGSVTMREVTMKRKV